MSRAKRLSFTVGTLGAMALVALMSSGRALAQRNEVGLLAGATLTSSQSTGSTPLNFNPSLAFTIEYGHRLVGTPVGSILAGVDFAASPLDVITNSGPPTAINQYAYIFLTPELRYQAPSLLGVKPWVSAGGGYARFREAKRDRNGQSNSSSGSNSGAAEVSGGVDLSAPIHLFLPIGLRFEVRDYISGQPRYNVSTSGSVQNNVVLSGGFLIKF